MAVSDSDGNSVPKDRKTSSAMGILITVNSVRHRHSLSRLSRSSQAYLQVSIYGAKFNLQARIATSIFSGIFCDLPS